MKLFNFINVRYHIQFVRAIRWFAGSASILSYKLQCDMYDFFFFLENKFLFVIFFLIVKTYLMVHTFNAINNTITIKEITKLRTIEPR